jgi:hypothetical protein
LPAASVARTSKVWLPDATFEYAFGEEHDAQAPASIRHSNVVPPSFAENPKLGLALFVGPEGPESI